MTRVAALLAVAALALGACTSGEPLADAVAPRLPRAAWTPSATIAFEDSVHALVVFVRFEDDSAALSEWDIRGPAGREALPAWGSGLIKETPGAVTAAMGQDDPSLSAYFFWQSQGAHILTGEVWPRDDGEPHVYRPARPSTGYAAGRGSGYGYLVQEMLDALVADGLDLGRFDANRDGELDHLMLIVRRDPAVPVVGGVAALQGVTNGRLRTQGTPGPTLVYSAPDGEVVVDMNAFGSGTINWVGGEWSVRTLVHEYGHILLDMGHTEMITPDGRAIRNDVPFEVPASGTGAFACQYNRMCGGGGSARGRPSGSSNYDGTLTLSGYELRRLGWARRTVLDPALDHANVTVAPLFASGEVVLLPLREGSGADTLSLENRHRTNAFDRFPPLDYGDPFYGLVYRDLPAEGLLATLTHGSPTGPASRYLYDFAPPSNALAQGGSRCDGTSEGCIDPYGPTAGDMYGPRSATQITPWTRPNVSGYTFYPAGFEPNWFAVTDIRFVDGGPDMAFDVVADIRQAARVDITKDSWMGAETSGWTFRQPVRVRDGATLRVWQGAEVRFDGGLAVAPGARFECEPGATCWVDGERVRTLGARR